jgi:hypothetical protein
MTEADFSNKHLGVSGAIILAAVLRCKTFLDSGALSKLTFCGIDQSAMEYRFGKGDPVTINTTMTEADFSGKKLGVTGAQILVAFMSTKLFEAKGSLCELDLSKNDLRSEGLCVVSEALKSTSIKQLNIAENNSTFNMRSEKDMSGVIKFTKDMKDMGSLSTMTFGDNGYKAGDKVEAQFKGKGKHYPGKIQKVNTDGTYYFLFDDGDRDPAVAELSIKSGSGQNLAGITVTTGMTEADFSGAAMGPSGTIILAAWLEHKVQHTDQTNYCWFGLTTFSI